MERGVRSSSTGRFACGNEVGYWQLARQGDGIVRRFVKVVGNMVDRAWKSFALEKLRSFGFTKIYGFENKP